jgi:hypothetical protein
MRATRTNARIETAPRATTSPAKTDFRPASAASTFSAAVKSGRAASIGPPTRSTCVIHWIGEGHRFAWL